VIWPWTNDLWHWKTIDFFLSFSWSSDPEAYQPTRFQHSSVRLYKTTECGLQNNWFIFFTKKTPKTKKTKQIYFHLFSPKSFYCEVIQSRFIDLDIS
jgi:hypothetical protein